MAFARACGSPALSAVARARAAAKSASAAPLSSRSPADPVTRSARAGGQRFGLRQDADELCVGRPGPCAHRVERRREREQPPGDPRALVGCRRRQRRRRGLRRAQSRLGKGRRRARHRTPHSYDELELAGRAARLYIPVSWFRQLNHDARHRGVRLVQSCAHAAHRPESDAPAPLRSRKESRNVEIEPVGTLEPLDRRGHRGFGRLKRHDHPGVRLGSRHPGERRQLCRRQAGEEQGQNQRRHTAWLIGFAQSGLQAQPASCCGRALAVAGRLEEMKTWKFSVGYCSVS